MNQVMPYALLLILIAAIAGITLAQMRYNRSTTFAAVEMTRNQYIAAIATQLAAPHLSPDPRHAEENRLILDHWVDFTRKMFQSGVLPG